MKVFIKNRRRRKSEFQFFMHQFIESGIKYGVNPKTDFKVNKITKLLSKILISLPFHKKSDAILVSSQGYGLMYNAFPYYGYEIIPMLWDVWPETWTHLYNDLKKIKCKIAFVTVRSMAEKIHSDLGIDAYWIPEGIDINDYKKGRTLRERNIDVYELGRQMPRYHNILEKTLNAGQLVGNTYNEDGSLAKLAYPTAKDLLDNLNKTKIIVSFPQTDTHPQRVGNMETLTQRYWEAMLSGCLILGRAPKELIDLIGYNPVVDIDWNYLEEQIHKILNNIDDYQAFVDKNYETAKANASWDLRIQQIFKILSKRGYSI